MKILITGSEGFIGKNMVHALKNEHELKTYNWGENLPDLKGFDVCIHLGAISSTVETNIEKVLEQNYDFSKWLLEECWRFKVHFQYASSASVYGLGSDFKETAPVDPKNPYAWSKFLFERYVAKHQNKWECPVQGFRYFNVYGPHEDHKGNQSSPFHKFSVQARTTGVIELFEGSHDYYRDFVHVSRVIEVHRKFFGVKSSGVWNVGSGRPRSLLSVAEEISSKTGAMIKYIPMPNSVKNHYQSYTCANLNKLRNTIDYD
jgi:ADP-L-glycero-D-manno-heptose 6-epimerase